MAGDLSPDNADTCLVGRNYFLLVSGSVQFTLAVDGFLNDSYAVRNRSLRRQNRKIPGHWSSSVGLLHGSLSGLYLLVFDHYRLRFYPARTFPLPGFDNAGDLCWL